MSTAALRRAPNARPRRLRAPRGAAAVEFAIGVPIVLSIFIGGFVLVYASMTRERLTTAVTQSVRFCAMQPVNIQPEPCVRNLAQTILARDNERCAGGVQFRVEVNGDVGNQRQISMLRAVATCAYLSPVWPNRLPPMNLTAEARMPRMPVAGP